MRGLIDNDVKKLHKKLTCTRLVVSVTVVVTIHQTVLHVMLDIVLQVY